MEGKTMLQAPASTLISSDFKLVSVPESATLITALSTLINADIYGAPVASESKSEGSSAWIGFLELTDIVSFIVSLFQQQATTPPAEKPPTEISSSLVHSHRTFTAENIASIDARIKSITVKELFAIRPPHSSAWSLTDTVPIQTIIDALSSRSRVVLLSSEGKVTGLVSRSALVNHLAKNVEALEADPKAKAVAQKTLASVPGLFDNRKMITTPWHDTQERALDSFARIAETRISHLALVAGEGGHFDLAGNVSVKDIKPIIQVGAVALLEPVAPYINRIRQENLRAVFPAIHESLEDTIDKCMVKLAVTKIHRMYVTGGGEGAGRHLVGVVTLGDIIRLFRSK